MAQGRFRRRLGRLANITVVAHQYVAPHLAGFFSIAHPLPSTAEVASTVCD